MRILLIVKFGVRTRAFTTIEVLVAITTIIVLLTPITITLSSLHFIKYDSLKLVEDDFALNQLRTYLIGVSIISVDEVSIEYQKEGKLRTISLLNQKVISQPGTLVFLSNIDEVHFLERNGIVYLNYCRNAKYYERWIAIE